MTTAEVLSIAYDDTNNDLSENEVLNYVREFKVASQTRSSSTITNVNIVDKYYTGNNTKARAGETLSIPFYKVKIPEKWNRGMRYCFWRQKISGSYCLYRKIRYQITFRHW